jgi:tellurite resistance protein TerC
MDLSGVAIIIQLVFLEGVLSIDNAAVLGAMVAHLPNDKPIPWPRWLPIPDSWQKRMGMQREAALKVGLLGAYVGRGLMLLLASVIIQVQWIRVLGAAYLLYLGIEHLGKMHREQQANEKGHTETVIKGGFWATVLSIELADLAFSIDNVVAAIALSDQLWVVMLGVAIGIVVMRFAAGIFTRVIEWEPAIETGAYLLLLAIGAQLLVREYTGFHLEEYAQFFVSFGILGLTIVVARTPFLRKALVIFRPFLMLAGALQWVVEQTLALVLSPFRRRSLPTNEA